MKKFLATSTDGTNETKRKKEGRERMGRKELGENVIHTRSGGLLHLHLALFVVALLLDVDEDEMVAITPLHGENRADRPPSSLLEAMKESCASRETTRRPK